MGDFAGFCEDVVGEDVREMVLADDDLDVDAEGVGMAEDFEDAAAGGTVAVGKSVISTSTARPSRLSEVDGFRRCGFFAEDAMRRFEFGGLAGISMPSGMTMGWVMRSSKGVT